MTPTIAIFKSPKCLIQYGVEKYGSLVTLYSIFADNHGKRAKAIERVKNDKPNLNSLGLTPLAS